MVTLLPVGKLRPWLHQAREIISAERHQKMLSYRQEEDRLRSFGAALLLRQVSEGRPIYYTAAGKPYAPGCSFSLSHGGDYAGLAEVKPDISVGLDIEKMMGPVEEWAGAALADEEYQYLSSCETNAEKTKMFYRLWTRKESLLKCEGRGFMVEPEQICTLPMDRANGISYFGDVYDISSLEWQGHILSVALAGKIPRILVREITDIGGYLCEKHGNVFGDSCFHA